MAVIEKWTVPGSWVTLFNAADMNSLANGSSVMSGITPISVQDCFADWSFQLGSITAASPNNIPLFLYPLNSDGTTYGDNQFVAGTQAVKIPSAMYSIPQNLQFPTGAATIKGTIIRVPLFPGTFLPVLFNQSGAPLAASGNVAQFRLYNRQAV